jgi:hypothetical protein
VFLVFFEFENGWTQDVVIGKVIGRDFEHIQASGYNMECSRSGEDGRGGVVKGQGVSVK